MGEYTFKDLYDRDKLELQDKRDNQLSMAEKDLTEGMEIMEGLSSGFWKIIRDQFIAKRLDEELIDTCAADELLAVREQRRVLRDLIRFLETKAQAGKRASRFLKTLKQKEAI